MPLPLACPPATPWAASFPLLLALLFPVASSAAADVTVEPFGETADGVAVEQFVLTNANGTVAKLITRGATLRSLLMRDREGRLADVVFGFDDVAGYESDANQYFGCTTGRVCNRIAGAQFEIDGETFQLEANDGNNTLHGGGSRSLDKVVWEGRAVETEPGAAAVEFTYFSPDGEEGFPGNMHLTVRYTLTAGNALTISYRATADLATPVNLTNHAYFNLAGAGAPTVLDHVLQIDADAYTPTDDELIPTGEIASVVGTPLDFRTPTAVGARIDALTETPAMGYDHNYVLNRAGSGVREVAVLRHQASGRVLRVLTDQPGLQLYSGNFLFGQSGKEGKTYAHRSGLCLEAQHFPDSVNQESFPSILLLPGQVYRQTTLYQLAVE